MPTGSGAGYRPQSDCATRFASSVKRSGRGPVSELADGIRDAASYGDAVVIVLHSSSARAMLSSRALSPYRFSIRLATRQMSISGITHQRLHGFDHYSCNTRDRNHAHLVMRNLPTLSPGHPVADTEHGAAQSGRRRRSLMVSRGRRLHSESVFGFEGAEIVKKRFAHLRGVDACDVAVVLTLHNAPEVGKARLPSQPSVRNSRAVSRRLASMIVLRSPMMSLIFEPVAP